MKTHAALLFFALLNPAWSQLAEDFESPGYTDTEAMDQYNGWSVSATGAGVVSSAQAANGSQSVELAAQAPLGSATRTVAAGEWSGAGVSFVDFMLLPVADDAAAPLYTVEIDGASLAWLKVDAGGGLYEGALYALDGAAPGGPEQVDTQARFAINASDEAAAWMRVTLRQDYAAGVQTYDLYLDGRLIAVNLGFDGTVSAPGAFTFTGDHARGVYLDDLSLSEANPLFEDADRDGISSLVELALGLNPDFNDRELDLDGDGINNIAEIVNNTPPQYDGTYAQHSTAHGSFLYVDGVEGSDASNGLAPYASSSNGPKATVGGAISVSVDGGVIAVLPGVTYTEGNLQFGTKNVTLKPVGDVRIK